MKTIAFTLLMLAAFEFSAWSETGTADFSDQGSDEPVVLVNGTAVTKVKLQVMNKMFMPDSFNAKKDQKVELTLQSLDGAHGISIPAFNFKLEVGPKESKTGEFTPDKDGKFPFEDTTDAANTGTLTVKK